MAILLRCDICGRITTVPRLTGTGRLDLRASEGWWLVGSGEADSVIACSELHLHQALAERGRRPEVTCSYTDEAAYAWHPLASYRAGAYPPPMADITLRAAMEELDVARHVGDPKRIVAAKAAIAALNEAAEANILEVIVQRRAAQ